MLSHIQLLATPRTADYQAPPSMGCSRQEYWRGLPLPSPYRELVRGISLLQDQLDSNKVLLLHHFSRVQLCVTPETAAHQAPPSLGFSRQEHCSGLPIPSPGHLPDPRIEPRSPAL